MSIDQKIKLNILKVESERLYRLLENTIVSGELDQICELIVRGCLYELVVIRDALGQEIQLNFDDLTDATKLATAHLEMLMNKKNFN